MTFPAHPQRRPAVVSGASSGIGEAVARALAAAGHPVALGARRVERCADIAREIAGAGGEAIAVELDVTDAGSVKDFVAEAERALGGIEVLVSNAGQSWPVLAVDATPEDFARAVEVNLLGAQRLVSLLAPKMVERRRGDIVFVTSESVHDPWPGIAPYVSSKWGLEGLARAMQRELEGTGVRTSIVRPGPTLTEMGTRWELDNIGEIVDRFHHWGVFRHGNLMTGADVAAVIAHIVATRRGAHVTLVDLQPEAPIKNEGGETD
ncbi:MAG: SDR family oxidoreductase [Actinomycetota bacterium]